MWDDDDVPSYRTFEGDPFRGVFDFNAWAANRRDASTGLIWHPLGTTQAAIAKWETGRTLIGLDRLARVSDVTGCPVALYFDFGGSERGRAMWL